MVNFLFVTYLLRKAIPIHTWTNPEVCRSFGARISIHSVNEGGKVISLMHRPPLPNRRHPGTHFCYSV